VHFGVPDLEFRLTDNRGFYARPRDTITVSLVQAKGNDFLYDRFPGSAEAEVYRIGGIRAHRVAKRLPVLPNGTFSFCFGGLVDIDTAVFKPIRYGGTHRNARHRAQAGAGRSGE